MPTLYVLALFTFFAITGFKDLTTNNKLLYVRGIAALLVALFLAFGKVNGL